MMVDNHVVIFISSPNSYADVFRAFLKCLQKNWNDCPFEIILSTNNQIYQGITVYNNNSVEDGWMDRAIPVLKKIDKPYVFLICDDCLISKRVDNQKILNIISDMEKYKLDFCGVANHIKGKTLYNGSLISRVKKNKPYALNLQAGIYKLDYLLSLLGNGEQSPWELENKWLQEASKAKGDYYANVGSCNRDLFGCKNGVLKGKWFWSAAKSLKKMGIEVDSNRPVMSRLEEKKLVLESRFGKVIPASMRPLLKKFLKHFGKSFASDS